MEAGHLLRVIDKLIKFYIISHNIFKWIKLMLLIKVNIRQISKYCALNKYLIYLNICLSVWPSGYSRRLSCERVWVRNPEQASLTRATILPRSVKWAATIRQWVTAVEDCECKPQVWEKRSPRTCPWHCENSFHLRAHGDLKRIWAPLRVGRALHLNIIWKSYVKFNTFI